MTNLEIGLDPSLNTPIEDTLFAKAKKDVYLISILSSLINVIGVMVVFTYLNIAFGFNIITETFHLTGPVIVVGFCIASAVIYVFNRKILQFFLLPNQPVDDDLRRDILNYSSLSLIDFLIWIFIGAGITAWFIYFDIEDPFRIIVHMGYGSLITGSSVALVHFYTAESLSQKHIIPLVMGEKRVSDIPGVVNIPIYVRLIILIFSTAIGPTIFIYLLYLLDEAKGSILLFTLSVTLFISVWQGIHIVRAISQPIGQLAGRLERFRNGETEENPVNSYRTDAIGQFSEMFDDFVESIEERNNIRSTFGRYLSPELVDEILSGKHELGGSLMEATVMFADIRGFTSLSESLPPEAIVELLNDYLEAMVQEITSNQGLPDKFLGDGLLALWGIPKYDVDHEINACQAAIAMLERLKSFNEGRRQNNQHEISIGIGLHSGSLIAGNIGSRKKMEYTVIGDTVNTASRVEGMCKELRSSLLISEQVYVKLPEDIKDRFGPAQQVTLRGKQSALGLYSLIA